MKKLLFSLFAVCALWAQQATGQNIVITEIMYNPPEGGTDSLEYFEVYNTTNATIDMSGWRLDYGANNYVIPSLSVPANGYHVFAINASAILNNFNVQATQLGAGALSNNGATIKITNAANIVVDEVTFDDMAPWPTTPDGNGPSLELCTPSDDNSVGENWIASNTPTGVTINSLLILATPGTGCQGGATILAQADDYTILPGQSITMDVLGNDILPNPVTSLTIDSAPSNGTATVTSDNRIVYVPAPNFCGNDDLVYKICDAPNSCATGTVSITVKCYPQRTIGEMNNQNATTGVADSVGASCELTGTVYGVNIRPTGLQFVIINATGTDGLTVFRGTGNYGYTVTEGDNITVRGSITQFNGLTQIATDTVFKVSGGNALVAPSLVGKPEESTENRLIRINKLRLVDPTQWAPAGNGFVVRVVSDLNTNDTIALRIDNDVDLFQQTTPPGEPFDLIGLGGQFDSSNPFTSGYQILPRYTADIFPSNTSTQQVDFSHLVTIAPNPVEEVLLIQSTEIFDQIQLMDLSGRIVQTNSNPNFNTRFDMSKLSAGIYALRFQQGNGVWTTRVVKQ
jgi:Lamin Tail Domain/Secretion system C-terminal sorting domain/Bacterial Ig domain